MKIYRDMMSFVYIVAEHARLNGDLTHIMISTIISLKA